MTDDSTAIDILALEDFHATLATRRSQVESVLSRMTGSLADPPALGGFHDARQRAMELDDLRRQYGERVGRLYGAIVAAEQATATIISNYRSTERQNRANANDIARALDGIHVALAEENTGV